MRRLGRRKGVTAPDTRLDAVRDRLRRVGSVRDPLYLNEARIGNQLDQRDVNVTEIQAQAGLSVEGSGGIPGFGSVTGSGTQSTAETIPVTPLLRALILEDAVRQRGELVDLSNDDPKTGSLLYFVGAGRILMPGHTATDLLDSELGMSPEDVQAIDEAREKNKQIVEGLSEPDREPDEERDTKPDTHTVVWVFRGLSLLASIASLEDVQYGEVRHCWDETRFGILGTFTKMAGDVALLRPFLIWHEASADEAAADTTEKPDVPAPTDHR